MIRTGLTTKKGTINHVGTSGFTVTSTRKGQGVYTQIEYSETSLEELREAVCVLLCWLEDGEGEKFVAGCFARYAQETGKQFIDQENGRKLVLIRGDSHER